MRFWKGECSRSFTDWRGYGHGVEYGAWLTADAPFDDYVEVALSA